MEPNASQTAVEKLFRTATALGNFLFEERRDAAPRTTTLAGVRVDFERVRRRVAETTVDIATDFRNSRREPTSPATRSERSTKRFGLLTRRRNRLKTNFLGRDGAFSNWRRARRTNRGERAIWSWRRRRSSIRIRF